MRRSFEDPKVRAALRSILGLSITPPRHHVTLYTKRDCSLCEHAKAKLERARKLREFDLEEIDITSDPDLEERYRVRIPVVAIDGREVFEHRVILDELLAILETPVSYETESDPSKP